MDGPMINIIHATPYKIPEPDNWITEVCNAEKKK
jgi:hypothetical protein